MHKQQRPDLPTHQVELLVDGARVVKPVPSGFKVASGIGPDGSPVRSLHVAELPDGEFAVRNRVGSATVGTLGEYVVAVTNMAAARGYELIVRPKLGRRRHQHR